MTSLLNNIARFVVDEGVRAHLHEFLNLELDERRHLENALVNWFAEEDTLRSGPAIPVVSQFDLDLIPLAPLDFNHLVVVWVVGLVCDTVHILVLARNLV